jgi:pimeloyl-ACP methyl ester carboxylesterase
MLWILLFLYVAAFVLLASLQRTFMYHPERGDEKKFLTMAPQHRVSPWRDRHNQLIGWKRVLDKPAPYRMLILHGNGGHALTRTYFMDGFGALEQGKQWEFYNLEFPGYAWREGNTTEAEIVAAADEALEELLKDDARPLYITGESLGTGIACLLAARHPDKVRGLFLATPYTSITDVAQGRFPIFPVRLAMQDRYEAAQALRKYHGPVAILLAGRDFIVPTRFGQALFDGYNGPKKLWIQPNAGHNTLDYDSRAAWWKDVSDFLLRH